MKNKILGLLALALFAGPASAAIISYNLDFEFSEGTQPAGPAPWVTATFEDLVGGGVRLTIATSGLVGTEFMSEILFNFDPAKNSALLDVATPGTGSQTDWNVIARGNDQFKADGDGFFDIVFDFPPPPGDFASKFTAGETFIADLGVGLGVTVADFDFPSVNGSPGKEGFFAAAHIQGIGPNGEGSGWIADDDGDDQNLAEPGSIALLGFGLAVFGLSWRRRTR